MEHLYQPNAVPSFQSGSKTKVSSLRPEYRRRLEIILRTEQGQTQSEICAALGCARETVRYWQAVAQSGQITAWVDKPIGRPKTINPQYLDRLKELVTNSPKKYGYPFRQWTAHWLAEHLAQEFDVLISDRHINRLLSQMGLSTRHRDPQDQSSTS
jgi:transposase